MKGSVLALFLVIFLFCGSALALAQVSSGRVLPGGASGSIQVKPQAPRVGGLVGIIVRVLDTAGTVVETATLGIIQPRTRLHLRVDPPTFRNRIRYRYPRRVTRLNGRPIRSGGRYTIHTPYGRALGIPKIQRRRGNP